MGFDGVVMDEYAIMSYADDVITTEYEINLSIKSLDIISSRTTHNAFSKGSFE